MTVVVGGWVVVVVVVVVVVREEFVRALLLLLLLLLAAVRVSEGMVVSRREILLPNRPPIMIKAAVTARRAQERMKVGRVRLKILRSGGGGG
jgi:hypothetical protein